MQKIREDQTNNSRQGSNDQSSGLPNAKNGQYQ